MNNTVSSVNLVKELRNALKRNELTVVYQPQVDIRTGRISGNEALLRWTHPEYGIVSPSEFIPLVEETGLIVPIGEWVMKTACAQNKAWQDTGVEPMTISVNLSPRQFTQRNFVAVVRGVLKQTGLDPQYLDLEITEGMTMDVNNVLITLQQLKELGVRISMDDFGKGYSSLYYLKRLPLDSLKIDQSFVSDCTVDESDATIVKTIISMAHHLNLNVIAEGVETKEQLVFLQKNLCDEVQGYLFSKPLPAEELVQRLSEITGVVKQNGMDTELSERMWIEEQLRAARQDLEDTVRKQQGMTFKFTEQNGRFIHTLCDGELLYRFNMTPEHIVGKELYDTFPSDYADRIIHSYRKAWQGEPHVTYEDELNGIWFLASLRPNVRGGKVIEVIGNCIDITERKRVEDELKSTKEQLESFFYNTSDAIAIKDLNGNLKSVNESFLSMFGWTTEEIIRKPLPNVPEHLQEECRTLTANILAGEVISGHETVRQHKDGSLVNVSLTLSAIKDAFGHPVAIAETIRDISQQKQAEIALKESEEVLRSIHERYRLIAENMSDLITVFDADLTMKYVSPSHQLVLGYPANYFNTYTAFNFVHPEDIDIVTRTFTGMMLNKSPRQVEFRYRHKNGKWVHVEAKVSLILAENGEIDRIIMVSRDVTERKIVEAKFRKSEALAVVGELAAGVAQEIRNPLTTIKGFVQLMRGDQFKTEYFDVIFYEFKNLETKIDEFVLLAQPQVAQYVSTNIWELLQDVLMLMESLAILNNVQMFSESLAKHLMIMGDRQQLKQVFVNLLKNAIEGMPGGGEILVRTKQSDPHYVSVIIIDQGCGISEERLKRMGEPFFSSKEKGTGLGLNISHKIAKEHGASIVFESELNKGTTIEVSFPILK